MDNNNNNNAQKKPLTTVLQGDGFYFDRLLLRQSSIGQSSHIYYRNADGVPFQWEMQPGTPKNPPENDVIPPLTPPPAVHSLGLPKPCVVDQSNNKGSNRWTVWFWKKIKKKNVNGTGSGNFESSTVFNSEREFVGSPHDSSSLSSSSSSSSSNCPAFQRDQLDGPLVCGHWNITKILSEGNIITCYCSTCKAVYVPQGNGFILSKIVSRNSSVGQSSRMYYRSTEGVPFKWEMQPGKSKDPIKNEVIPPPSPPPAVQSHGLPRPCIEIEQPKDSTMSRLWFWKKNNKNQQHKKVLKSIFYNSQNLESSSSNRESVAKLRNLSSLSLSSSSSSGSLVQNRSFQCSPWRIKGTLVDVIRWV
ncbi:hypothetical protein LOK49_LG04G00287 [Camellia lanceoleosa]|uniref:Uncharacterized protein n=1 Tax=Camellia lanceoleosa TaxID=1840588 RepID=A0ACC0I5A7_9ERIC|nr:hypothetical protein LOK49_LG04G00287 [Camellia lanceoleosa]